MDVFVLSFFRPAAEQDHERILVPAKINAVTRAEVDFVFIDAAAYTLCIREIPCSMRVRAIVTFAAAEGSSDSNQLAKRFFPFSSM